jgi:hypothetical protein
MDPEAVAERIAELRRTAAYKRLSERFSDEEILFIHDVIPGEFCGRCWEEGPYCCYDSVCED